MSQAFSMVGCMTSQRPWRGVDRNLFGFATSPLHELHVALMAAFEDAAIVAPALNIDQVRGALDRSGWDEPVDEPVLVRALAALVEWGHLDVTQDHAGHYATPEEFERKNLQWSLTRRGEAAIGGVLFALESLRHAVGLQPAVLDAIGDGLAELAELLTDAPDAGTPARIHVQLAQVEGHLNSLVVSVRQFNGHLQRLLRSDATDDDVFADVKRRTVAYLQEYVAGVERPRRRLAVAVDRLVSIGPSVLFDQALVGANLAPIAGDDPAPTWLAERRRRWDALRAWFAPADHSPQLVNGLLDIARTAIVELLRVLERRWDGRRRSASVANDFRRLAAWFDAAPGEAEAHRLFAAAFGMWSSRHAHLAPVDGEERRVTTPWTLATPVDVAPSLRTTGSTSNRGRSASVGDPAAVRAQRQREQAARLLHREHIRAGLVAQGTMRLSTLGKLPAETFAELLALIAMALDALRDADGARRAMSLDGGVEIVVREPHDRRTAAVHTDDGVLRGPDLSVTIVLTGVDGVAESDVDDTSAEAIAGA